MPFDEQAMKALEAKGFIAESGAIARDALAGAIAEWLKDGHVATAKDVEDKAATPSEISEGVIGYVDEDLRSLVESLTGSLSRVQTHGLENGFVLISRRVTREMLIDGVVMRRQVSARAISEDPNLVRETTLDQQRKRYANGVLRLNRLFENVLLPRMPELAADKTRLFSGIAGEASKLALPGVSGE
jgi:hypothetical protein